MRQAFATSTGSSPVPAACPAPERAREARSRPLRHSTKCVVAVGQRASEGKFHLWSGVKPSQHGGSAQAARCGAESGGRTARTFSPGRKVLSTPGTRFGTL